MQKIFIVRDHRDQDDVHDFIGEKGKIISVTPNVVSTGSTAGRSGKWLVVADNGENENLLP